MVYQAEPHGSAKIADVYRQLGRNGVCPSGHAADLFTRSAALEQACAVVTKHDRPGVAVWRNPPAEVGGQVLILSCRD
jgi:hypothetical protein